MIFRGCRPGPPWPVHRAVPHPGAYPWKVSQTRKDQKRTKLEISQHQQQLRLRRGTSAPRQLCCGFQFVANLKFVVLMIFMDMSSEVREVREFLVRTCERMCLPNSAPHPERAARAGFCPRGSWSCLPQIHSKQKLLSIYIEHWPACVARRHVLEVYWTPCFHGFAPRPTHGLPDRIQPSGLSPAGPALEVLTGVSTDADSGDPPGVPGRGGGNAGVGEGFQGSGVGAILLFVRAGVGKS
jgi:hypothetical protein